MRQTLCRQTMGRLIGALACAALLLALSPAAPASAAEPARIALLIGNQSYKSGVGSLANPHNDIAKVGDALRQVGFEVMQPVRDGTRATILLAVNDFAARLAAAGPEAVGFLYYSGHGIASGGENYIIPVDVAEPSTRLMRVQGVKQSELLAILRGEAPNAAHYLVLDACRNELQGAKGGKGFVHVQQQSGALIAFATAPGQTASDKGKGSGPYAAALAAELVKPGQSDLIMFHNVRTAVIEATGGDQVPWTLDGISLRERPIFAGRQAAAAVSAPAAAPARPAQPPMSEAAQAWLRVDGSKNAALLRAFIAQYPGTVQAILAGDQLAVLASQVAALAAPAPEEGPDNTAAVAMITEAQQLLAELGYDPGPADGKRGVQTTDAIKAFQRDMGVSSRKVFGEVDQPLISALRVAKRTLLRQQAQREREAASCTGIRAQVAGKGTVCLDPSDPAKREFQDCRDGFCGPQMVALPTGSYLQGDETAQIDGTNRRKVTIGYHVAVGKFEVTFDEWDACVKVGGCKQNPGDQGWGRGKRPVIKISWEDITQQYLPWLNRKLGLSGAGAYRLLTEAEWEFAARAGTATPFSFGATISTDQANYNGSYTYGSGKKGTYRGKTIEVGSLNKPNAFGLHDMHGNVWEWVQDCYADSYAKAPTDGSKAPETQVCPRVLRGGAWINNPQNLRSADRGRVTPGIRSDDLGFRVARSVSR